MPETKKKVKSKKRVSRSSYLSKEYFIDCEKNDMLYAALVRSPLPTGKITNINFSVNGRKFIQCRKNIHHIYKICDFTVF